MKKKILACLLMLAMIMSFMPTTAYAGGVADGSDAAVTNSTLKVQESVIAYAGMEWNLIGSNMDGVKAPTGALTLLNKNYEDDFLATLYRDWALSEDEGFKKSGSFSGTVYGYAYKLPFNTYANEYKGSKLHNTLEAATENIPNEEKYLAIPRNLIAVDAFSSQGDMIGDGVPNQIYWPLSERELADVKNNSVMDPYNHNGYYTNTADGHNRGWWLRSGPIDGTSGGGGDCAYFGTVYSEYWQEALAPYTDIAMYPVLIYARPAMYLNIKDAVFLSSVADGKSDAVGTISQVGDTDGTLKFTMKSSNQNLKAKLKGKTDDAYIIEYSNATTGENQYISCVLTDKSGAVKYYGKLKAAAEKKDTQGTVTLPKTIDGQNIANYTVKIFDEKIKAGNFTDFCSAPIVFNLNDAKPILTNADLISVHNQSITINGGSGTKEDPNRVSVDIDKTVNQIAVKDLVVSNGANAKIYEDETFAVDQVGIMLKDGENHLYVKVTAGDGVTSKYYNITISRESTPTPPPKPSGGNNYMVIMENDGHGSASASIDDQKRVTLTATPHDGYRFDKWEVVTGAITIADNSFTMPESNVTVKAHFKAIPVPPAPEKGFDIAVQHPSAAHYYHVEGTGDETQNNVTGNIEDIVFKTESGYVFPASLIKAVNGIQVKVSEQGTVLTISGTPTDNVAMTLLSAIPIEEVTRPQTEAIVTFKIENGSWSDDSKDEKTVKVVLFEGKGTLKDAEVPTGMKPNRGYESGAWDATPNIMPNGITGNVTYTYRFKKHAEATITFKVKNGTWADGSNEVKTVNVVLSNGKGTLKNAEIPTSMKPNKGYKGGEWDITPNTAQNGIAGDVTYTYSFAKQSSGGGGITQKYTLSYESNGGTEYDSERYAANKIVKLDKVPSRENYKFTGWYADKALTKKITEIKMTSDKTVYAGWKHRGNYIPEDLNSKDHVAYVSGYVDGTVKPNNDITRAETASMLYRLLTDERRAEIDTTENHFSDVRADAWYANPVFAMNNGGYIAGYADGTFGGEKSITRAEFVAMLVRFIGAEEADCNFSDVSKNHWAYKDIATATVAGWIGGYPDGTFGPNRNISRAEAMSIINRVLDRGVDANSNLLNFKQWPDNSKGTWCYYEVIEATNNHEYTGSRPSENWTALKIG